MGCLKLTYYDEAPRLRPALLNNPVRFIDPDGLEPRISGLGSGYVEVNAPHPGIPKWILVSMMLSFANREHYTMYFDEPDGTKINPPSYREAQGGDHYETVYYDGPKVIGGYPPLVGGPGKILGPLMRLRGISNLRIFRLGGARSSTETARSLGIAGERAVGTTSPKTAINVAGRTRIPDAMTRTSLTEVKNVKYLSYTRQLRDFQSFSQQTGRDFILYTKPNTTLSGPLQSAINQGTIIHRPIPFRY